MDDSTQVKVCTKCGETKSLAEFNRDRGRTDGRTPRCKVCLRAVDALYRATPRAKELSRARVRKWLEKPENKELAYEAARRWRELHPEYSAEANRKWRDENPGAAAAYHQANRDKTIRRVNRRRERIKATAAAEPIDLVSLWRHQCGICPLCGQRIDSSLAYPDPLSKSVDHIVPLSRGGTHERANCQFAHLVCNIRKGARAPDQQAG